MAGVFEVMIAKQNGSSNFAIYSWLTICNSYLPIFLHAVILCAR